MRAIEITVGGLSAYRAVEKLRREKIPVLGARRTQKNGVIVRVDANVREKVFAILRSSCYNIEKVEECGLLKVRSVLLRAAGLLLGICLAAAAVFFLQGRVLRIEVVGSGAYLGPQVRAILFERGVHTFSAPPEESDVLPAILSLPRVGFCSVEEEGGVLRIRVEVDDETKPLESVPLLSPASGRIEEMLVLRGTPLCAVGDEVQTGQTLVHNAALFGEEERKVVVIALVKLACPFCCEYALTKEQAEAQTLLDFGTDADFTLTRSGEGWRAEGVFYTSAELNYG